MAKLIVLSLFVAACAPAANPFAPPRTPATQQPGEAVVLLPLADYSPSGPSSVDSISEIALSHDYLFCAVAHQGLYRMPKYGGAITTVDSGTDSFPLVTVGNERVFWFNREQLLTRAADGGATSVIARGIVGVLSNPGHLQADGQYVYYVSGTDPAMMALMRVPVAGGAPTPLGSVQLVGGPPSFAVDGGDVFYVDASGVALQVVAAGSSTSKTLATLPSTAMGISGVDGDTIYLALSGATPTLLTVSRSTGATAMLELPAQSAPSLAFLADAHSLYLPMVAQKGTQLVSMPLGGGPTTPISRDDGQLGGRFPLVAQQDEANLFFVVNGGEVLMLPKKPTGPIQ
jgi:hypothetical protein